MNIIIVGCGKVGQALCRELAAENHTISVVDIDGDKVNALVNECDVMGYIGSGLNVPLMQEAEIEKADLILAITHSDETNLMCCLLAKHFGNCTTIARVRDPQYAQLLPYLKDDLNLVKIINPEALGAAALARVLRFPSAIEVDSFSNGLAEILTFRIREGSILDKIPVKDIHSRLKADLLVCAINRKGQSYIPDGDFILKAGDKISVAGSGVQKARFLRTISPKIKAVRKLMVVGGGLLTYYLIRELENDKMTITVIDDNPDFCERLSEAFDWVTVVNGEGCDESLLEEEGIRQMDAFAALSKIDEENILLSMFAKREADLKAIAKVDKIRFDELLESLDLDTVINLKELSAQVILRYVRSLNLDESSSIKTLNRLSGQEVEAIEWRVRRESAITGKPLTELSIKPGVLIAGIVRKGKNILPRGNDQIKVGDSVIVVTNQKGFLNLLDIFE